VYFNDLTARRERQKVIGMAQNITIGSWLDHALVSFAGGCFVHLLRSDSGTQGVSLIRLGAQINALYPASVAGTRRYGWLRECCFSKGRKGFLDHKRIKKSSPDRGCLILVTLPLLHLLVLCCAICFLATATISSVVKPNFFSKCLRGADAPNVSIQIL
jgi:hypothetical protein